MDEFNILLNELIKEKGGTVRDYKNLLKSIAYHESAHTLDSTIKQRGGGPGRGKYQFEEGDNRGGITAARRTKKYFDSKGIETPKWLNKALESESLDATKLSSKAQDVLFLGNMRMHPKADFKKVWDGKESVTDFWSNYHWAGKAKDRPKRLKSFEASLKDLQSKPQMTIPDNQEFQSSTFESPTMFAQGGNINSGCGGPGEPPCDPKNFKSKQFYNDYLSSDTYIERLKLQNHQFPEIVRDTRLNKLKEMEGYIGDYPREIGSQYVNHNNSVMVNTNEVKEFKDDIDTVLAHEISHGLGAKQYKGAGHVFRLNENETKVINDRNRDKSIEHDGRAHELKADLDSLRYKLFEDNIYDTKTQKFNQKYLNKAKIKYNKNAFIKRIFDRVKDEDIIYLMNNIASTNRINNNNEAAYGGLNNYVKQKFSNNNLNSFNTGGLHENNPHGGIPQGVGSNGKMNTVEQGETSFNIKGKKFIFSDRIDTKGTINQFVDGGAINSNCGGPGQPPCKQPIPNKQEVDNLYSYIDKNKKFAKEKEEYYNPPKPDYSTGDKKQDFLYKNDWLLDMPIIGDKIKAKAKDISKKSTGIASITQKQLSDIENSGKASNVRKPYQNNLLNQYFSDKKLLPKSKYKPSNDYLEFLPSYSVKGNIDNELDKPSIAYQDRFSDNTITRKEEIENAINNILNESDNDFFNDKKPIYRTHDSDSELSNALGVNLAGHKTGMAWDEKLNLPYISISDAWDFSPEHYSKKWGNKKEDIEGYEDLLSNKEQTYVQSYLMHKAGNPFKVYDRFYFDPKTKKYIPDSQIEKIKKKNGK